MNLLAPDALRELAQGQRVALVSATNGKTTTTRLLKMLERRGWLRYHEVQAPARRTRAFVYSTQKSPGVYRFVFVADDLPSMNDLVRALAAQRAPFEGALEVVARRPASH